MKSLPTQQKQTVRQTGAALVEFVLIVPLLITLIFGILEFGILIYDKIILLNAVNVASRQAITYRIPRPTSAQISQTTVNYCANHLVSFGGSSEPSVSVNWTGSQATAGNPVTVSISYTYTGLLLSGIFSSWTGGGTLSASSTMIVE